MPFASVAPVSVAPITATPTAALPYETPTVIRQAIIAPGNLVATQVSGTQIDLTWSDFSWNENGFILERGTDGVTFGTSIAIDAGGTSYSNTGLANGTTYYYRIRAYQLAKPTGLVASLITNSGFTLSWGDNSTHEAGYSVELDGVENSTVAANVATKAILSLNSTTTYVARVRGIGTAGTYGPYSDSISVTTESDG